MPRSQESIERNRVNSRNRHRQQRREEEELDDENREHVLAERREHARIRQRNRRQRLHDERRVIAEEEPPGIPQAPAPIAMVIAPEEPMDPPHPAMAIAPEDPMDPPINAMANAAEEAVDEEMNDRGSESGDEEPEFMDAVLEAQPEPQQDQFPNFLPYAATNPFIDDQAVPILDIGDMSQKCEACGAFYWAKKNIVRPSLRTLPTHQSAGAHTQQRDRYKALLGAA
jgi:hypothetical protein